MLTHYMGTLYAPVRRIALKCRGYRRSAAQNFGLKPGTAANLNASSRSCATKL